MLVSFLFFLHFDCLSFVLGDSDVRLVLFTEIDRELFDLSCLHILPYLLFSDRLTLSNSHHLTISEGPTLFLKLSHLLFHTPQTLFQKIAFKTVLSPLKMLFYYIVLPELLFLQLLP